MSDGDDEKSFNFMFVNNIYMYMFKNNKKLIYTPAFHRKM